MRFSEKSIRIVVAILKPYYLVLPVLAGLGFVLTLNTSFLLTYALPSLIGVAVFIGLQKRKSWVVFLVLILSAFAVVSLFLYQPENIYQVLAKFGGLLINVLQIFFFTRKEVRSYFKTKDTTLFGG